ncbi:hypothetical protein GCM10010972_30750 [Cellulomonas carbonis]|nr:hypothetical protein GCM10010972_30750 [Cellulomonas carbonis]
MLSDVSSSISVVVEGVDEQALSASAPVATMAPAAPIRLIFTGVPPDKDAVVVLVDAVGRDPADHAHQVSTCGWRGAYIREFRHPGQVPPVKRDRYQFDTGRYVSTSETGRCRATGW